MIVGVVLKKRIIDATTVHTDALIRFLQALLSHEVHNSNLTTCTCNLLYTSDAF